MNKVGFTEEQQAELSKLIGIATRAARLTTDSVSGTDTQIAVSAGELITYIRSLHRGPIELKEWLDEIIRFCDLPTIIVARRDTEPAPTDEV